LTPVMLSLGCGRPAGNGDRNLSAVTICTWETVDNARLRSHVLLSLFGWLWIPIGLYSIPRITHLEKIERLSCVAKKMGVREGRSAAKVIVVLPE